MSVWTGWKADLLTHAHLPNTTNNRRFLSDWHSHAETNCRDNPVDISVPQGGSTDCAGFPAITAHAQAYPTATDAERAFNAQIHQSAYSALLSALKTGNPYTATNTGQVSQAISAWGSQHFAQRYLAETVNAPGRGGGIVDGDALKGWTDIQRSVNRRMPAALRESQAVTRRALRTLGHVHRVKL